MSSTPFMNDSGYSLLDIVGILYRWRKRIAKMVGITALVMLVVVFFLPNYYTSTAIIVPANEERELFRDDGGRNISLYGNSDAMDRTLIFANSTGLAEHMIRKYKLSERYDIDSTTPKGQDKLIKHFRSLYDVRKNEHAGIEISVQDKDPAVAAELVNGALEYLSFLCKNATTPNKALIIQTYENTLAEKHKELKAASDSLMQLRIRHSIYDVKNQSQSLSWLLVTAESQLAESEARLISFESAGGRRDSVINTRAKIAGLSRRLELMKGDESVANAANLKTFNEGKEKILYFDEMLHYINRDIGVIQSQYSQFKAQSNSTASPIIILEAAQIPKIKSYPSRALIVIGAVALAFILAIIWALLMDAYGRVNWKAIFQDKNTTEAPAAAPANPVPPAQS